MHELDRLAPRWEFVPLENLRGQRVGQRAREFFERQVNDAPHGARANAADGFVNRNDAAHFGRVRAFLAEHLEFRIDHLDAAGPHRVQLGLPMQNEALPGLESFLQDIAREKICRGTSRSHLEPAGGICRRPLACTGRGCRSEPAREWCTPAPARSREFLKTGCGLRTGKANTREGLQMSEGRVSRGFPRGAVPRPSGTSARL